VVSHRPQPAEYAGSRRQPFAGSIEGAITQAQAQAQALAGDRDVAIQGGVTHLRYRIRK
jgi:hypothetical protein